MEGMFNYESDELDQNSFNIYTKSEYIEMIWSFVVSLALPNVKGTTVNKQKLVISRVASQIKKSF